MRTCGYCGCESNDSFTDCPQCGLSLTPPRRASLGDLARRFDTPLGRPITSALGAILVSTGVYMGMSAAYTSALTPLVESESEGLRLLITLIQPRIALPVVAIATASLAYVACARRCKERWHAIVTAAVTCGILMPPAFWLGFLPTTKPLVGLMLLTTPAGLAGLVSGSTIGLCVGACFQIALGAWLLGWFGRPKTDNPTPTD